MNVDRRTGEPVYRIGIDARLKAGRVTFVDRASAVIAHADLADIAEPPPSTDLVLIAPDDYEALFEAADAAGEMVDRAFVTARQ